MTCGPTPLLTFHTHIHTPNISYTYRRKHEQFALSHIYIHTHTHTHTHHCELNFTHQSQVDSGAIHVLRLNIKWQSHVSNWLLQSRSFMLWWRKKTHLFSLDASCGRLFLILWCRIRNIDHRLTQICIMRICVKKLAMKHRDLFNEIKLIEKLLSKIFSSKIEIQLFKESQSLQFVGIIYQIKLHQIIEDKYKIIRWTFLNLLTAEICDIDKFNWMIDGLNLKIHLNDSSDISGVFLNRYVTFFSTPK